MEFLNTLNGIVWGWPMLALIALTGLYRFQQGIINENYQIYNHQ